MSSMSTENSAEKKIKEAGDAVLFTAQGYFGNFSWFIRDFILFWDLF